MTPAQIIRRLWLACVRRWHHSPIRALRESGDDTHAHQARVAQLLDCIFPDWTREEMRQAIWHDAPESWHGDPSYEAKQCPQIRSAHNWAETDTALRYGLPHDVTPRVKLLDGLDALLWAQQAAPHVMTGHGFPEQRAGVLDLARELGVGDVVEGVLCQS